MPIRPLRQPPLLHDLPRLIQHLKRTLHIPAEEPELPADFRLERLGRGTREGRDALGVDEGCEELFSVCAELVGGGDGGDVDVGFGGRRGGRVCGGVGLLGGCVDGVLVRVRRRWREVGLVVFVVLQVFGVSFDEGGAKRGELLAQLWRQIAADEVFDGFFGGRFGVDFYLELLCTQSVCAVKGNVAG